MHRFLQNEGSYLTTSASNLIAHISVNTGLKEREVYQFDMAAQSSIGIGEYSEPSDNSRLGELKLNTRLGELDLEFSRSLGKMKFLP